MANVEYKVFSLWSDPERGTGNGAALAALLADGWTVEHRTGAIASGTSMMAPLTSETITLVRVKAAVADGADGSAAGSRGSAGGRAAAGSSRAAPAVAVHPDFDLAAFGRHYAAETAGAGIGAGIASGLGGGGGSGFPGHHQVQQRALSAAEVRDVTLRERWNWLTAAQRDQYGDVETYCSYHQGVARGEIIEGCGAVSFDGSRSGT